MRSVKRKTYRLFNSGRSLLKRRFRGNLEARTNSLSTPTCLGFFYTNNTTKMPIKIPSAAGESYRPSNGTEGMIFCSEFCEQCVHEKFMHTQNDNDKKCDIFNRAILFEKKDPEYPTEWVYDSMGVPTCTSYVNWNWGNDKDGWNDPTDPGGPLAPFDPDQLLIPFDLSDLFGLTDVVVHPRGIFEPV